MKPLCHICHTASDYLLNKDSFDLYKCDSCKLVFVHPQPTAEFLKNDLYSYESGYQANRVEDLAKRKEDKRAKTVLDILTKLKPGGRILDVGCANGQFMYWAKQRGFVSAGVELNRRTAEVASSNGFEVFNGFLGEASFPENSFDAVFLGEIIEHVPNPREFVKNCSRLLRPGGLLAITTPNLNCFWSKSTFFLYQQFKTPWSSVTPPYHLHQFSDSNLDLLMSQENFELVAKRFLLMTRLKYELGMTHLLKRYKKSRRITNLLFAAFSYGLYTILYILNILTAPFRQTDFNMIRVYQKTEGK
jgi:2-polyprenyl-3-methyl-5-hydroxy-6-metoxy-1,4-benzoquinol methylase